MATLGRRNCAVSIVVMAQLNCAPQIRQGLVVVRGRPENTDGSLHRYESDAATVELQGRKGLHGSHSKIVEHEPADRGPGSTNHWLFGLAGIGRFSRRAARSATIGLVGSQRTAVGARLAEQSS